MELTLFESLVRLLLSFLLGGVIGYERERNRSPAGFRTHIIVAMSSCLAMLISFHIYNIVKAETSMDPTRMGSYVISGIGFLGAGTIIREGANVKGLTTAASLWASACIGLAVGAGLYEISLFMTVLILITLLVMYKIEYKFSPKAKKHKKREEEQQQLNKDTRKEFAEVIKNEVKEVINEEIEKDDETVESEEK